MTFGTVCGFSAGPDRARRWYRCDPGVIKSRGAGRPGGTINILLTSAGRRNYLVEYFREALRGRGRVFAADAREGAPALQEADGVALVPPVGSSHYLDALLEFCEAQRIGLLVPLSDLELPGLAAARERFAALGTTVLVSSPVVVGRCADKWATYEFLRLHSFRTPATYLNLADAQQALAEGRERFPLVLKPRWGSAALGLEFVYDDDELELGYEFLGRRLARTTLASRPGSGEYGADLRDAQPHDPDQTVLVQAFVAGDEYSLDLVCDPSGRYVTTLAKQKLGLRAGDTDSAVTVSDPALSSLGRDLCRALGPVGVTDCDVFITADGPTVLELNPRFGNAYPFAHVAGADLPAAIVAWAHGDLPEPGWLRAEAGVTAARYSRLMLTSPG